MYLANCTGPDLSFAVGRLASCMKTPCHRDWERVKRFLRYINGTSTHGLTYRSQHKCPTLHTYVDAAYGVDPKRGRSITGYVLHLGSAPIIWRSHLQTTVADSPNASEYIALYEAAVATETKFTLLLVCLALHLGWIERIGCTTNWIPWKIDNISEADIHFRKK